MPVLHVMERQEVIRKLDEERKLNIARGSALVKCTIVRDTAKDKVGDQRCPKCTLIMPCKHFRSSLDQTIFDLHP